MFERWVESVKVEQFMNTVATEAGRYDMVLLPLEVVFGDDGGSGRKQKSDRTRNKSSYV